MISVPDKFELLQPYLISIPEPLAEVYLERLQKFTELPLYGWNRWRNVLKVFVGKHSPEKGTLSDYLSQAQQVSFLGQTLLWGVDKAYTNRDWRLSELRRIDGQNLDDVYHRHLLEIKRELHATVRQVDYMWMICVDYSYAECGKEYGYSRSAASAAVQAMSKKMGVMPWKEAVLATWLRGILFGKRGLLVFG